MGAGAAHTVVTGSPRPADAGSRGARIGAGLAWLARWSGRWVLIALAAVLVGLVVRFTWVILFPLLLALLLTTVLERPARGLERRLRMSPTFAALATVVTFVVSVLTTLFLVGSAIGSQSSAVIDDAAAGAERLQDRIQDTGVVSGAQLDTALRDARDALTSGGGAASGVLTGAGAVSSALVSAVIVVVLTFFFLRDGRRFVPWVRRVSGPGAGVHLGAVLSRSWEALGGYVRAQALVSAIDAVLIGIALLLVGVPLALPLAVLTFVGGFVPIVGAISVGVVAVLVALAGTGVTGALIILAVVLAVQVLEGNVLSPWLQGRAVRLHPAVVLLSVALGSSLFGIAGAFLAVPAAAVAATILRYLDTELTRPRAGAPRDAPAAVP